LHKRPQVKGGNALQGRCEPAKLVGGSYMNIDAPLDKGHVNKLTHELVRGSTIQTICLTILAIVGVNSLR